MTLMLPQVPLGSQPEDVMMEIKQEQDHSITSPDESASLPLENDFRIKSYQELEIRQLRK